MRVWLDSIYNGTLIFMAYFLVFAIPVSAISILHQGKINPAKAALNMLFSYYMCCVFALVFLPLPTTGTVPAGYSIQLIPGYAIYDMLMELSAGKIAQILFNIVMTVPFGAYLKYYWKMDRKMILAMGITLTLFIEIGQLTGLFFLYPGSYRCCDVDDVILNTMGTVMGGFLAGKCSFLPELKNFDKRVRVHRTVYIRSSAM